MRYKKSEESDLNKDTIRKLYDNTCVVHLASGVRLRREYFGGLVYDTCNGNTMEVDKRAFQFLNLIKDTPRKISDVITFLIKKGIMEQYNKSDSDTLQKLFELKIIETSNGTSSSPVFKSQRLKEIKYRPWLSAPETVHWAVTYRCDENCPDCYTARFSFVKNELDSSEALKLIDKIADWNVFQLAIGGGEPFARKDLPQLVRYAAARGLSVHITTGKWNIAPDVLESVSPYIKNLQIGIRTNDLLGGASKKSIQQIQGLFIKAQRLHIRPGANLFLTKLAIKRLENLIAILMDIGFNRIILLRYKPPKNIERWEAENPEPYQLKGLHDKISRILRENPHLNIRVDCALSFVQRQLTKEITTQYGIKGCIAADRIVALAPDGSVYPCSQLVHPHCCVGNLLGSDPKTLWDKSKILHKYRFFYMQKTFIHSWCGICLAKDSCGGCRIFAMDGLGGDPGCPEPLLPPLSTQISKIRSSLDLAEYMKRHSIVSAVEYKECIASYASYKEILHWREDPSCLKDYPRWIKQ
jgi:radical SAM protein with 4Fe4S-binding SPASM domain